MSWPSLEELLWRIQGRLGAIEAMLQSNREEYTDRLDRIENRINKDKIKLGDLLPYLPGAIVLVLWLTGRIDAQALVGLLSGR